MLDGGYGLFTSLTRMEMDGKNMYLFCIEETLPKLMNTPIISVINLSHCGVFSA